MPSLSYYWNLRLQGVLIVVNVLKINKLLVGKVYISFAFPYILHNSLYVLQDPIQDPMLH